MGIMSAHDDYYHRLKRDSLEELATVVADEKAETCRELREQLAKALLYGNADEAAAAIIAVIDVRHAHHELKENGAAPANG